MRRVLLLSLALACLAGCGASLVPSDAIGEAYVAPATLTLRRELTTKSDNVATLVHGEHVSVLDVRRRFVKIRSARGREGWVDAAQLLSRDQMAALRQDTGRALRLPPEGNATVYEALNIHIDPSRTSPAIGKVAEGGSVTVLAHRLTAKNATPPKLPALITERPAAPARRKRDRSAKAQRPASLPPMPKPPKAPENWQSLSAERVTKGAETVAEAATRKKAEAAARKAEADKKPVVLEDWTLVRTNMPNKADVLVGWVLSRNLLMSIPDEVAQYAEGKRITSYFDLGAVVDEEKGTKHNWLWTTLAGQQVCDFNAWRVFLWNRHRHRYETSYRQRDVEGYFPVTVDAADAGTFGRTFHLITKEDDGRLLRHTYVFDTVRVHLTGTEPYEASAQGETSTLDTSKMQGKPASVFGRIWSAVKGKLPGGKQGS